MLQRFKLKRNSWLTFVICLQFILSFTSHSNAQVTTNGDFESSISPPSHREGDYPTFDLNRFPSGWYPPTGGSPDYFNDGNNNFTCSSNGNIDNWQCYPNVCTITNVFGEENPRGSGNHSYCGFAPNHEYIQTGFTQLTQGGCYSVDFWVSQGDLSQKGARLQVLLSHDKMLQYSNSGPMDYSSDTTAYVLTCRHFIFQKIGWVHVHFDFKATGHEQYMTIGVFDVDGIYNPVTGGYDATIADDPGTACDCGTSSPHPCGPSYQDSNGNTHYCQNSPELYYYIDDVSLNALGGSFTPNFTFTNQTIPAGTYNNKLIILTGNCTTTGSVTFNNCDVYCNNNSSLVVPSTSSFHMIGLSGDSTTFQAGCDLMWYGVIGNGTIEMNHAVIKDAIHPLTLNNGSAWQLNHAAFRRNAYDIEINGASSSANYIKDATFDHSAALLDASQGYGGYGVLGIQINGTSSTGTITIGGTGSGEGCTFIKGQYGVLSDKADVTMNQCHMVDVVVNDVEFTSMATTKRSLLLKSCEFENTPLSVYSHNLTNLEVHSCEFINCASGINWYDNPNCNLYVGDSTAFTQGNVFIGSAYPIVSWNNKSTGINSTIATGSETASTDIVIMHNSFQGSLSSPVSHHVLVGVGLYEYATGVNVAYRMCRVEENLYSLTEKAIDFGNLNGWGMVYTGGSPPPFPNTIDSNAVSLTTTTYPWAKGIALVNSAGWLTEANGISSDAPANWQNYGVYLENSPFSDVVGNAIAAGTGILLNQDVNYSNVHCNSLDNNSCGINLAQAVLRPNGITHGYYYASQNQWEAYQNFFETTNVPWSVNIQNYLSDTANVKWVWDNTATSSSPKVWNSDVGAYETNKTAHSLISTTVGGDSCDYRPVFGGKHVQLPYSEIPDNAASTLSNPVAQWNANYSYQVSIYNGADGDSTLVSNNIRSIIKIENELSAHNFSGAAADLSSFSPSNQVEQNLKDVYLLMVDLNDTVRSATEAEVSALMDIASQDADTGGRGVYIARTYLFVHYKTTFPEKNFTSKDYQLAGTAAVELPCDIADGHTVLDFACESGELVNLAGATLQPDGSFTFDPFQMLYLSGWKSSSTRYRIYAKQGSTYTVIAPEWNTAKDWIAASPISIQLAGALVVLDELDTIEANPLDTATRITDSHGQTYYATTKYNEADSSADVYIVKKASDGHVIWGYLLDGPVSGNDSATCITIDSDHNVLAAGKVWTGANYNLQVMKLDSSGNLIWSVMIEDSLQRNCRPYAIDHSSGNVKVNSMSSLSGTPTKYRYVELEQCVPKGYRLSATQQDQHAVVQFYPNPSDGRITVNLNGSEGGLLELFNMEGQLVYSKQVTESGEINLPSSAVPNSIYLLKFTGSGKTEYQKLVIHRN